MYPWKQRLSSNRAVVLTTLLYGCESWTLYRRSIRRLDQFHLRYLRKIARVKCQGRIPNTDVLNTCGRPIMGIEAFLLKAQLRWVGHIMRIYFLDNWQRENVCNVGQSCGTKTLWRLIWSSVASTRRPWVTTLRIVQPGELCALKQSPSSKIRESKFWNIKEQFGRGSTSQQPQRLAMWQLLSRSPFQNWTPRPPTNSPMTSDPFFSTAQSVHPYVCRHSIRNFYDHRSHCTTFGGELSDISSIFASVIQGSALGPASYVVNTGDLRPVTIGNEIIKYADDTYLIVSAENTSSCQPELDNISQWASDNNLRLNINKTFEIIFNHRGNRGTSAVLPPTLPNIQRVTIIKALGITITSQLSMNLHVDTPVESCGKTLYGLRVLRAHGMSDDFTQEVFRSIVTAKLTYASQAWSGFCTASDTTSWIDF